MTRGAQISVATRTPNQEVRLLRFRADGTIDQTFGSRGVTLTSIKA